MGAGEGEEEGVARALWLGLLLLLERSKEGDRRLPRLGEPALEENRCEADPIRAGELIEERRGD